MEQRVTEYIDALSLPWQAEVCARLRATLAELSGVDEVYKWNSPFYLAAGKQFASYSAFAKHVRLNVFNAADLAVPDGFFDSSSTDDRLALIVRADDEVDYATLARLLGEHAGAMR